MNTWPNGRRHAMSQDEHEKWNATHYPGTRQLCASCDEPTGRCEEDALYAGDYGPFCEGCWTAMAEAEAEMMRKAEFEAEMMLDVYGPMPR